MVELISDPVSAVLWGGALLGMAYGVIGQWSRFCAVGGLLDWRSRGHGSRLLPRIQSSAPAASR